MTNGMNMAKKGLKTLATLIALSFFDAANAVHIEPVFNEAAGGSEDGGGATWHKWAPIGLPGAKFHAMTGQMEKSHDFRRSRAEAKGFRNTVLDRADYYDSFEKVNSLKM